MKWQPGASASTSSNVSAHAVAGVPQLQLAHARRVDHQPAARQHDQLAMRGRVASLGIGLAHLARLLHVGADQAVDDRALADA